MRHSRRRKWSLLFLTLFVGTIRAAWGEEEWQVIRTLRLYVGPSSTSVRITTLHPPETLWRLESETTGNYAHVRTRAGVIGWVYARYLTPLSVAATNGTGLSEIALSPLNAGEMRAHVIDVGQGAATLFEFSCGAVLVDTGGEKNHLFDSTTRIREYLTAFFQQRPDLNSTLDLVVLTHPHIDHTRGVATILEECNVRNVVDNGQTEGSGGAQQRVLELYAQDHPDVGYQAIRLEDIDAMHGLTSQVIDPITCPDVDPEIRVLWGQVGSNPGWGAAEFKNANNHSVVVRLDFGQSSFLVTGDLEEGAIESFLERYRATTLLDTDVYEVGHHGSRNGTTPELITALSPELAVISMGSPTRKIPWSAWQYGHPNKGIVLALEAGVTGTREAITVSLGIKGGNHPEFEPARITHAIYGTGWDGTVVISAAADGRIRIQRGGGV